jgi:hypothetical protein
MRHRTLLVTPVTLLNVSHLMPFAIGKWWMRRNVNLYQADFCVGVAAGSIHVLRYQYMHLMYTSLHQIAPRDSKYVCVCIVRTYCPQLPTVLPTQGAQTSSVSNVMHYITISYESLSFLPSKWLHKVHAIFEFQTFLIPKKCFKT